MSRIFISYGKENQEIVTSVVEDLESLSHQVWFDRDLTRGQAWWNQILAEIRQCDVFVFALSPESLDSYACKLEFEYANALGKSILPIVVGEGVSAGLLPPALSKVQFVDLIDRWLAFQR
jgi:TIR domain